MFTVIGEAVVDLVQGSDGRFTAHPGGSPLNAAVGLARLGHPTAFMARFATSAFGRRLREHAVASGVDVTSAVEASEAASLAVVTVGADGGAAYDFYVDGTADWQWTPAELAELSPATRVLHTGSLACFLVPGASAVRDAMRTARDNGLVVSFDPNIRPRLLCSASDARVRVQQLLAYPQVVKVSDEDLAWLCPGEPPVDVARRWQAAGPALVVVTYGGDGALAVTRRGVVRRPARKVPVVDTVGAGDAFTAGLLSGLADRDWLDQGRLGELDGADLAEVLDEAILIAGLTCTRAGADPPTRAEVTRVWSA
jgi:fructokinase